jgi:cell division protein FtsI (penicillin-binding protein 3)
MTDAPISAGPMPAYPTTAPAATESRRSGTALVRVSPPASWLRRLWPFGRRDPLAYGIGSHALGGRSAEALGWLRAGADARHPVEVGHNRLIVVGALFTLVFSTIAGRLVEITLISPTEPHVSSVRKALPIERGEITDRNGVLLATSLGMISVYADPRKVLDPADAATQLARVLPDLNEATIRARLASARSFVYVKRDLTPRQEYDVNRLGLPGIFFQREDRRIYPQGAIVSHVLGFSDVDNHGLAGIEKYMDERLRASETVQLSIDLRVQNIARQELGDSVAKFHALGGAALVMDAHSGELLAMVSLPDFDPNEPGAASDDARFNRATLGVYEMGSTFKIFNTAMALETGTTTLAGRYDATHPIQIARFTITDYHAERRWLSVPEIFMYSSNIGSVRMALDAGTPAQRAFLDRLHMLTPLKIELPEVGHPRIPMPWRPINTMTIAFGHGISVSPLHLVAGTAAVVNGGILVPPTLVKREPGEPVPGERVMSLKTSESMRKLMRLVVEQGTGKMAAAAGYMVGGKTGTAEKNGKGGYREKALLSNFAGAFPMDDPQYVVFVMLDEPQGNKESYGFATAGWTAAPAAGHIIARIAPLLGMMPEDEAALAHTMAVDLHPGGPRVAAQ